MQPGTTDLNVGWPLLPAISQPDTVPVVRVPWNDPATIMKARGQAPRGDNPAPVHLATCDKIREAAHTHGIKAVMHCASAAFAVGAVKRGFDMVMLTSDLVSMIAGVRRQLDELQAATA
jgi:4-hydroxy-2-oxoheptanedioate aldolase